MSLPRDWSLTLTAACRACDKRVQLPGESLPRAHNALRVSGWRYLADIHGWACSGDCRERLEREARAAGYGPAA